VGIDRTLPREEFFYRQLVSSADFLKAYHASAHRADDYRLAPGYPAFCIGGRQVEVAILRTGILGDDEEPAYAAQRGDDLVDHAVGEILLLRVAAHIGKRQHSNRRLVRKR